MSHRELAIKIGEKLTDLDYVLQVSCRSGNTFFNDITYPWDPYSLDFGYPALIIFFSEMNRLFPSQLWEKTCKTCVANLVNKLISKGYPSLSLSSGLTGISFALFIASRNEPSYRSIHQKVHNLLLSQLQSIATPDKEKAGYPQYDLMCGICGYLSYLLHFPDQAESCSLIERFLLILIGICGRIKLQSQEIPAWLNPPGLFAELPPEISEEFIRLYPHGFFDMGMAHGVSGYLATLAKALSLGFKPPNIIESIHYIVSWLQKTRQTVASVTDVWPRRFAFNPLGSLNGQLEAKVRPFTARLAELSVDCGQKLAAHCRSAGSPPFTEEFLSSLQSKCDFYFDGWSYGAPGIYSSVFFASKALKSNELQEYCVDGIAKQIPRMEKQDFENQLSFCYGASGILTILQQFVLSANNKSCIISDFQSKLVRKIVERFDASHPFGFKCNPLARRPFGSTPIDNFGLVSGVSGILLSLIALDSHESPPWASIFLLN